MDFCIPSHLSFSRCNYDAPKACPSREVSLLNRLGIFSLSSLTSLSVMATSPHVPMTFALPSSLGLGALFTSIVTSKRPRENLHCYTRPAYSVYTPSPLYRAPVYFPRFCEDLGMSFARPRDYSCTWRVNNGGGRSSGFYSQKYNTVFDRCGPRRDRVGERCR